VKAFILSFAWQQNVQGQLKLFLNTIPQVKNWIVLNECSLVVASVADSTLLAIRIREKFPGLLFIVSELMPFVSDGWLLPEQWKYINQPFSSGLWPSGAPLTLGYSQTAFHDLQKPVWEKGRIIPNFSAQIWRYDINGLVMKFSEFGNRNSEHGWEIDNIVPIVKGGTNDLSNLQPLNWQSNQAKGAN